MTPCHHIHQEAEAQVDFFITHLFITFWKNINYIDIEIEHTEKIIITSFPDVPVEKDNIMRSDKETKN